MTAVTVAYGSTKTATQSVTPVEVFEQRVRLAAGASDTTLTLGSLSNPKFVMVFGESDISVKIASGTDALDADPFMVLADDKNGLGFASILLSNGGTSERTVYVYAEE